jgi:predicted DNA-binding transcriptional regulator YafY
MEKEYGTKVRLLRVMRALLENPKHYTKRQLAELYQVTPDTITNDFEALTSAGFVVEYDGKYRYYFVEEKPFTQLKDLLHFSEEDQAVLYRAIDQVTDSSKRGQRLKKKLASLYDYRRLGHAYLRKPYLTKVDLLMQGKNEKRQVILRDYSSSNSNEVRDRLVEPFHPSPPDDTLQAFDVDKQELRHFRISRITRVEMTDTPWQFEGHHNIMLTDPFRIVDSNQVMVHLRLRVGAKNELVERFPLTQSYIQEAAEEGIYDFQCMVNHRFLGLTNFILGFHHQLVEVLGPESLLDHLQEEVEKMDFS